MKRSMIMVIAFIAALTVLFGSIALGSKGRRAEAMGGGAVLVLKEKVGKSDC
ncbi:MAG: hypothetical protein IKI64_07300 [Clostridia bacterium]|nr:hypothetical protein [Clostridia bacterium]